MFSGSGCLHSHQLFKNTILILNHRHHCTCTREERIFVSMAHLKDTRFGVQLNTKDFKPEEGREEDQEEKKKKMKKK